MEDSIKVNVETTVSTTVRLDDLTLEKYFKIIDFIESVTGKKTPIFPKTAGNTEVKASEEKEDSGTDKYARVPRYKGYEKVVEIFRDAEAHPESYTWETLNTDVWRRMNATLEGVSLHSVSHVVGGLASLGMTEKTTKYNPDLHLNENYYRLPVAAAMETKAEPVYNPEDVRLGRILRSVRIKHGFSIPEIASGIGYDESVVRKWEMGAYHMAATAVKAICAFFKKDIFAEAKEASA